MIAYSNRNKIVQIHIEREKENRIHKFIPLVQVLDRLETKLTNYMVEIKQSNCPIGKLGVENKPLVNN